MIHIWQKLVFDLLFFLMFLIFWKYVTSYKRMQEWIHSLPCILPVCLQWYSLLIGVVFFIGVKAFVDIVTDDFVDTNFLDPDLILKEFETKGTIMDEAVMLPSWLRYFSLTSPFVGMLAFAICVIHFVQQSRANMKYAKRAKKYWFNKPQDMLAVVIVTPAIFVAMSIQSTNRMWMIFTGVHIGADRVTDMALFHENFELAACCQYVVVFLFARLCFYVMDLHNENKDIKRVLSLVGFQGVNSWILVGLVHSMLVFFTAYMGHNYEWYGLTKDQIERLAAKIPTISNAASLFSLQCTYNMLVICRLPLLKDDLGDVGRKFSGTKLMLLIAPNQLKVLMMLTSPQQHNAMANIAHTMLNLSVERAMLLHSSLMCYDCLAVVLFNYYYWRDVMLPSDVNPHGHGDIFYGKGIEDRNSREMKQPLMQGN